MALEGDDKKQKRAVLTIKAKIGLSKRYTKIHIKHNILTAGKLRYLAIFGPGGARYHRFYCNHCMLSSAMQMQPTS
jgi:hypothetical protein